MTEAGAGDEGEEHEDSDSYQGVFAGISHDNLQQSVI